ncbi:MAG: DNA polymerase III subunit delta [Bacteroidota bacterium]|nr:DNA polymerase III subunit delta [Bacteroidota bacterium]
MPTTKSNGLSLQEILKTLQQKKFSNLYLLYGEEHFLIDEVVDILIAEAITESAKSFNLDVLAGESADAKDIVSLASAFPMMSDYRIVVVRNFDRVDNKELLLPLIERPVSTTIAVFISDKADFRQKIYKTLQSKGIVIEFKQLYEQDISEWIARRIKMLGKKITPEACELLQSYVGRSLLEIKNEIDKLMIYVGDRSTIGVDDISEVVGLIKQFTIFELQKAIGQKDISRAIEILYHMLAAGESPVGMIVLLSRYIQKVWQMQELLSRNTPRHEISTALGIKPFFLKEYQDAARNYTSSEIEYCCTSLLETDEAIKSSVSDEKLIMTLLLYRMIKSNGVSLV